MVKSHPQAPRLSISPEPLLWVAEPTALTGEGDCDCACSTTPFAVEFNHNDRDSAFQAVPQTYTTPLNSDFYLAFSPFAPGGPAVLNGQGWQRYQDFCQRAQPVVTPFDRQLVQQQLIVPDGPIGPPSLSSGDPLTQLTVWLHVTNACNLDCPYCYVRKSSARLDRDRGYAILDHLFQLAVTRGFRSLKLKYAGGEATLEFTLIQDLHRHAQQLALETGIHLQAVVLSNGTTLSSDLVNWLVENRVRLMVSLDGLGDVHDRQRPYRQGQPSFSHIAAGLDRWVAGSPVDCQVSVTVTAANAPYLGETVAWILARGWPFSLNFYRVPPPEAIETAERLETLALEEETIIAGMRSAYKAIETHLPDRPLFQGLLDKVQSQPHLQTCGVGQSYIVVTHTGRIAQCQMQLDSSLPAAPDTGLDWLETLAQGSIQNLAVDHKEGCRSCAYRYRCTGGCPVETFRFTGRWDLQSPHCQIYKTLYPEVLRLEGMRLLKVNGFIS